MEWLGSAYALDGAYGMPLTLDGKGQTGKDGFPVDDDGTYTTGPYAAPLFGSDKSEFIPQHIEQGLPGIDGNFIAIAVYV